MSNDIIIANELKHESIGKNLPNPGTADTKIKKNNVDPTAIKPDIKTRVANDLNSLLPRLFAINPRNLHIFNAK